MCKTVEGNEDFFVLLPKEKTNDNNLMDKKHFFATFALAAAIAMPTAVVAQNAGKVLLPSPTKEAKPGLRWWWLGSAVDKQNLKWCLGEYARKGVGAVEITPIYGVQGNEANDIPFLSPKWMEMLSVVEQENSTLDIETGMATGTGWPFGGPWVPIDEAACKAFAVDTIVNSSVVIDNIEFPIPQKEKSFAKLKVVRSFPVEGQNDRQRVIALFESRTRQKVKRAAPGGEGYVIDHFDSTAVANYLSHISEAFEKNNTPFPHTFFNDSYEVYGANWTPTLFSEFEKRRGYRLEDVLDKFVDGDQKVVSDYRETLSDMLLNNFTRQWTQWAHSHGAITRNQAHGSPANLIDCYAAVDIPEIEGFGLTDFGIRGLRTDSGYTRRNDSDLSMLKYAPSAAHITGKRYTSSETFTWLTEHFRTSLSQMKPDLDLMFCAGVNRMFFHGAAYSPKDEQWPGWRFYASVDMSPANSIWRDADYLMKYILECQTWLQWGESDNDFLVYLPVRDMWRRDTKNWLMQFDIHSMAKKAPDFIRTILDIDRKGFDCDYISDRLLLSTSAAKGMAKTEAGTTYRGIIIPEGCVMPEAVKAHLDSLSQNGVKIIKGVDEAAMKTAAAPEEMKTRLGLKMIRRQNPYGCHYFIANLSPEDIDETVEVAMANEYMTWFDPMTSRFYEAEHNGKKVRIRLKSGESRFLLCSSLPVDAEKQTEETGQTLNLTGNKWKLSFVDDRPRVGKTFKLKALTTWENLSDSAAVTMGTGVYETSFSLTEQQAREKWTIDLGDVRESARVYINNVYIGCAWAVPFQLDCGTSLRKGKNTLRIEVTNLPANRIADMDRKGIPWRKMKEINVVDINYKKTSYAEWKPVKSGISNVLLRQMEN